MTFTLSRRTMLILGFIAVFGVGIGLGLLLGGGSSETTTTTVASQPAEEGEGQGEAETTEVESPPAEESSDLESCEDAGINTEPRNEGTCEEDGVTYVVVNEDSTLKLKELHAKLLGTQKAKTVSSEYGETKAASGTYVIFTLEITNKTHVPAYFDSSQGQVSLYIDGNIYSEDFEVENYALDDSFLEVEEIQPQGNATGTIAFDVPDSVLPHLEKSGNLDILNFSDESSGNALEVGTIRTYQ